jgi:hypothetical protein
VTLLISSEERDALYEITEDDLTSIGDLPQALDEKDYVRAGRLSREFADDLLFVLDDLGFGPGDGKYRDLTTSPDVLRRLLPRLRHAAEANAKRTALEVEEVRGRHAERDSLVIATCDRVIADLK